MSQTFLYRTDETPPVPGARVNIANLSGSSVLYDLDVKIDSGAGRTIIPEMIAQQLQTSPIGYRELEAIGGNKVLLPIHQVWLIIHGFAAVAVDVASDPFEFSVLLGRDVINEHTIVLDGPNQRVEIL